MEGNLACSRRKDLIWKYVFLLHFNGLFIKFEIMIKTRSVVFL